MLASALTSARPSAPRTAGGSRLPASRVLTLTLGRPPRGPSQGSWCRFAGDREPQAPEPHSPYRNAATRAARSTAGHSGREKGQGLPSPRWPSKAPRAKTLVPTLPLPNALTSAPPSAPRTVAGSHLPASWGLTLTLGQPPRGPSQGSWCRYTGDQGPQDPEPDSPCRNVPTRAASGAARHSGREKGQGPGETGDI